jgi:hypothetical protein
VAAEFEKYSYSFPNTDCQAEALLMHFDLDLTASLKVTA